MHISPDGLDALEDLALLRAVLRTNARSAGTAERALPTLADRFGVAPTGSGRRKAEVRLDHAPRKIATGS